MAAQPWNVHVLQHSCWRTFRWAQIVLFTSIQKPPSAQGLLPVVFPGIQQETGEVEDESSMMDTHGRRLWLAREADWGDWKGSFRSNNRRKIWSTQSDFSQQHCFSRSIAFQSSGKCDWYPFMKRKKDYKKNKLEIIHMLYDSSFWNYLQKSIYSHLYYISLSLRHWISDTPLFKYCQEKILLNGDTQLFFVN